MSTGTLRRLLSYLRRTPLLSIVAVITTICVSLFEATLPFLAGSAIDAATGQRNTPLSHILWMLVVVALARYATMFLRRYLAGRISNTLQHHLRMDILAALLELDGPRQDTLRTGQVVSRSIADLNQVQAVVAMLPIFLGHLSKIMFTLGMLWWISPILLLLGVISMPCILLISWYSRRTLFAATWAKQQAIAQVSTQVEQTIRGIHIVQAFAQEQRENSTLARLAAQVYAMAVRAARLTARYQPLVQQLPNVALVCGIGLGGWLALRNEITTGTFLAFGTYLTQITSIVGMLSGLLVQIQLGTSAMQRVFEVIDLRPKTAQNPQCQLIPHGPFGLSAEHLNFAFKVQGGASSSSTESDEIPLLRDVSFSAPPQKFTALVGPPGAGKTVLFDLILQFYQPNHGQLQLLSAQQERVPLDSLDRAALRNHIACVFEDPFIYAASVFDNIDMGRGLSMSAVRQAAQIAQIEEHIQTLAHGYDTVLDERGSNLSGGQRQRLALARALAGTPTMLLLDDATSAVDATTERSIFEGIKTHLPDVTILAVTHRHSTLEYADTIVLLDQGVVRAQDTLAALSNHPEFVHLMELVTAQNDGETVDTTPKHDAPTAAELWPTQNSQQDSRLIIQSSTARMAAAQAGASPTSGGRGGMGRGPAAMPATPELLARVDALPAATAQPKVKAEFLENNNPSISFGVLIRSAKGMFATIIGLYALQVSATLAIPWLTRHAIDVGVAEHNMQLILQIVGLGLVAVAIAWLAQVATTIATAITGERLLYGLRVRCYRHLQRLGMPYFERTPAGAIMTRMTTDIDALNNFLQTGLATAVVAIATLMGITVLLAVTSPALFLLSLAGIPIIIVATWVFRRITSRLYTQAREEISTVNTIFQEAIGGLRTTQAYGYEDNVLSKVRAASAQYVGTRIRSQTAVALYFPGMSTVSELVQVLVLGVGVLMVEDGRLATGALIAALLYLERMYAPISHLGQIFDSYNQAQVGFKRISEFLAEPSSAAHYASTGQKQNVPDLAVKDLEFKAVDFSYDTQDAPALQGLDIQFKAGTTVAIVGPTGAGKSTIIKLVERFYDPHEGNITVDGVDIATLDLQEWRKTIGYVPQDPFLFHGTIATNIAYGKPDASEAEIEQAADRIGALPIIAAIPGGFHAKVGDGGRGLSSGQRQLIALARAELMNPAILVFDEATATLDPATEKTVLDAAAQLTSTRTSIVVAHRLATAQRADRILVVADGKVVEDGTHDTLLTFGGIYARMWRDTTQQNCR